jgi:acyl dehydratase
VTSYIRDSGGFGGERGPSAGTVNQPPERAPDLVIREETSPELPAIYRLSGDVNPMHIDPEVASAAGYERPFIMGLCTFGIVGRVLLRELCDGDPTRFQWFEGRFTSIVFPGDALTIEVWHEGGETLVRTSTERGVVLGQSRVVVGGAG